MRRTVFFYAPLSTCSQASELYGVLSQEMGGGGGWRGRRGEETQHSLMKTVYLCPFAPSLCSGQRVVRGADGAGEGERRRQGGERERLAVCVGGSCHHAALLL